MNKSFLFLSNKESSCTLIGHDSQSENEPFSVKLYYTEDLLLNHGLLAPVSAIANNTWGIEILIQRSMGWSLTGLVKVVYLHLFIVL